MGAAAYYRGSANIRRSIEMEQRDPTFRMMDDINALPKKTLKCSRGKITDKKHPTLDRVAIKSDPIHANVWWMLSPDTMFDGFGFAYKSLRDAIRSWDISLTEYDELTDTWYAVPNV